MKKRVLVFLSAMLVMMSGCSSIVRTMPSTQSSNETSLPPGRFSSTEMPKDTSVYSSPIPNPWETSEIQGNVYNLSSTLNAVEQLDSIEITIKGDLPTPCHQVHIIANSPDADNLVYLEVYSDSKSDKMCAQVLSPFEEKVIIPGLGDGSYTLYINNEMMSEFQIPF